MRLYQTVQNVHTYFISVFLNSTTMLFKSCRRQTSNIRFGLLSLFENEFSVRQKFLICKKTILRIHSCYNVNYLQAKTTEQDSERFPFSPYTSVTNNTIAQNEPKSKSCHDISGHRPTQPVDSGTYLVFGSRKLDK